MSYNAIACSIKNIEKHPNADRLQICEVLGGFKVITGLETKIGDSGIYFPIDGQLNEEFAEANNLVEKYDEFGKKISSSGDLSSNRRIRALTLRGVRSEGIWLPLDCLNYLDGKIPFDDVKKFAIDSIVEGYEFDHIGEVEICSKYIPNLKHKKIGPTPGPKTPKHREGDYRNYKYFHRHRDTTILLKVIDSIKADTELCVTAKLHGTSAITGYVPVENKLNWFKRKVNRAYEIVENVAHMFKIPLKLKRKFSVEDYKYLNGSRNVVFEGKEDTFYKDQFRELAANMFRDQLHKGETVYYEIVGYATNGKPLMKSHVVNKEIKKSFVGSDKFKEEMVYSYGCEFGNFDIYVYRITKINDIGVCVDLSWDDLKYRCRELGIKYVPELDRFVHDGISSNLIKRLDKFLSETELKPSIVDPSHIEEGVCLRVIDDSVNPVIYKKHSFAFKVMEGKLDVPDAEEWIHGDEDETNQTTSHNALKTPS